MLCPNCKTENNDAANFCTNCRANLKEITTPEPASADPVTEPVAPVAPAAPVTPVATPAASSEKPSFIATMIGVCLKPMTTFKENLPKFNNPKNAGIVALIIVAAMTILSTITTVVGIVYSKDCVKNCSTFKSFYLDEDDDDDKAVYETKWEWKKLKNYDWFKNVGQTFLMNALTVAILSGAYFGMSKAFKSKTANIWRMVTVVALGLIPMTVTAFIAPILGGLNLTIGGIINWAGMLYSFAIILVGLNEESGVEGDKKVYLNIASAACIVLAYYIIFRFMYGEIAGKAFETYLQLGTGTTNLGGLSSDIDLKSLKY